MCNIEVYMYMYVHICIYDLGTDFLKKKKEKGMPWGLRRCWIWEVFRGMIKVCYVKFSKNQ